MPSRRAGGHDAPIDRLVVILGLVLGVMVPLLDVVLVLMVLAFGADASDLFGGLGRGWHLGLVILLHHTANHCRLALLGCLMGWRRRVLLLLKDLVVYGAVRG